MRTIFIAAIAICFGACGGGSDDTPANSGGGGATAGPDNGSNGPSGPSGSGGAPATGGKDAGGGGAAGGFNPPYPRIASYRIGGTQHYEAAFQEWAAKQAVVIIGGDWEGWPNGGARLRENVVQGIKSRSTIGTKVLQYAICDNIDYTNATGLGPTWRAQVDTNNWYLYANGAGGTHEINFFKSTFWQTNSTDAVGADSHGRKLEDAFAVYADATYRTNKSPNAAPSLDGHFHDNVLFQPRTDGDFDRNGTTDTAKSAGPAWRKGLRRYFDELAKIDPNVIRFANLDNMQIIGITDPTDTASAAPLDGILHGALLEGMMGPTWATETWAGWAKAMDEYRFRMNISIGPKLGVAGHIGLTQQGTDPTSSAPYRAMRYGIASVLLHDGYYAYSPEGYPDNVLYSFDELGGNAGGPPVGYLGYPTQPPPTAAWQNGVWRRDFDHGIALVNPKGNGQKTVTLGGTFKHLTGAQNPSLNDGSSVTTVTLEDRDGIILLR
jgi:hypothetical protein